MTKKAPRIFISLLLMLLCIGIFPVSAFASGGEETTESVAEQETAGDVSDLLSALAGSQVTVSVTEDGIQFSSGEKDSGQTGTVRQPRNSIPSFCTMTSNIFLAWLRLRVSCGKKNMPTP